MALLIGMAGPSSAANDLGIRVPDRVLIMGYWNLSEQFRLASDFNVNASLNPTDLDIILRVNQTHPLNLFDNNYSPQEWFGAYERGSCSNGVCRQSNVYFNQRYIYNVTQSRSLACEEVAPGVGLDHSFQDGSCMGRPVDWSETVLSVDHDRVIINAKY